MKSTPAVLCVIGAAMCVSVALALRTLDLSPTETALMRALGFLMLGCVLFQIGYAQSLHVEKRKRENRAPPPENPG
jgi:uncharacterized membrane protein